MFCLHKNYKWELVIALSYKRELKKNFQSFLPEVLSAGADKQSRKTWLFTRLLREQLVFWYVFAIKNYKCSVSLPELNCSSISLTTRISYQRELTHNQGLLDCLQDMRYNLQAGAWWFKTDFQILFFSFKSCSDWQKKQLWLPTTSTSSTTSNKTTGRVSRISYALLSCLCCPFVILWFLPSFEQDSFGDGDLIWVGIT
jgi:hypothetical protein